MLFFPTTFPNQEGLSENAGEQGHNDFDHSNLTVSGMVCVVSHSTQKIQASRNCALTHFPKYAKYYAKQMRAFLFLCCLTSYNPTCPRGWISSARQWRSFNKARNTCFVMRSHHLTQSRRSYRNYRRTGLQ